ncbi:MAG: hypothetical protein J6B72_02230 [Clostridia bacterium]|nr:hypothetical protein [Clostridia bacterium]
MKRVVSVLLLVLVLISCMACETKDEAPETTEAEKPAVDYHPAPDNMTVSEEEQKKGYKLYQGFFYHEGGLYYFYDTSEERLYWLTELIFQPDGFFDVCSTGDTVKIKGISKLDRLGYELDSYQISVVNEGEASDIPEDIKKLFDEENAEGR